MSASKLSRIDPASLAGNPRATYAAWLRFSLVVRNAMNDHPKPHTITPVSITPATYASRLRDAVRGAIAFGHADVPVEDLARWFGEVVVRYDARNVYIGPREVKPTEIETASIPKTEFSFATLTDEEFQAFVLLLNAGRISGPVHIETPNGLWCDPLLPNITFIPRPDGSLILL